jgi:hypothetical protein
MPSFIPVPNTVIAELRGTLNGENVENTLYFHRSDAWDVTSMGVLAAALGLWYRTGIVDNLSNEYQYRECYVADLTTASGLAVLNATGAGDDGGVGSEAGSNQNAFCVRFTTGRRGRSYRGRNYIPGVPESRVAGGRVSSVFADLMVAAYTILDGYGDLFGAEWSVVSRYADGAPRAFGISTPVIAASYSTLAVATIRGRRPE